MKVAGVNGPLKKIKKKEFIRFLQKKRRIWRKGLCKKEKSMKTS